MRLDISYDGRDFSGWARQPVDSGLRTVQGDIERVLSHLLGIPANLTCAGRTDAGVHARGQVAHVDAPVAAWNGQLDAQRINRALPPEIRVLSVAPAPAGFDARFSALWRRYSYRVCDEPVGPAPLERHVTLPWKRKLDLLAMNEAAVSLVGEHDFAAFCKYREGGSSIREIQYLRWERDDTGIAVMSVQSDAFCHSMVRSIVGVMLPVGDGRQPIGWPADVLRAGVRDSTVMVMPPYPLVLEQVGYPTDDELLNRQLTTRRVRTLPERA